MAGIVERPDPVGVRDLRLRERLPQETPVAVGPESGPGFGSFEDTALGAESPDLPKSPASARRLRVARDGPA